MVTTKQTKVMDTVPVDAPKKKSFFRGGGMSLLSRIAKSLMVPIAVLPFAALLNRVGNLMMSGFTAGQVDPYDAIWWVGKIISIPGAIVFDNLSLVFALGIGFGMSKDHRGEAALAATVAFLGLVAITNENGLAQIFYQHTMNYDQSAIDKLLSPIINGLPNHDKTLIKNLTTKFEYVDADGLTHYAQALNSYFANKSQLLFMVQSWDMVETVKGSGVYVVIPHVSYFLDVGVIGGVVAGGTTAFLYNRYREVNIPQSLSFFGGRRFIPMLAIASVWVTGLIFAAIWPWAQLGLIAFGHAIASPSHEAGKILGFGAYAFLNRLLQPMGLHHIINTFLWFQFPISGPTVSSLINHDPAQQSQVVFGDIDAFTKDIQGSGVFQSGFFPLYLGGLPAAGLAMTLAAPKENRKETGVFLASVAFIAFLTGIDEPLVFSFIFIAPVLFILNAIFTALMGMVVTATHISLGFGFSAGFIDYLISAPQSWQMSGFMFNNSTKLWETASTSYKILANPLMIFVWTAAMFGIYLVTFYPIIVKMNIETPGREKDFASRDGKDKGPKQPHTVKTKKSKVDKKAKYQVMAQAVIDYVGEDNISEVSHCTTRLRLVVLDNSKTKIDDKKLKEAGFNSVIRLGKTALQLVVGTDVEYVTNALEKLL